MNDEIQEMTPLSLPFDPDDKIFYHSYEDEDDEEENEIGEPYSYNEWIQKIKDMSGVNEEFLRPKD